MTTPFSLKNPGPCPDPAEPLTGTSLHAWAPLFQREMEELWILGKDENLLLPVVSSPSDRSDVATEDVHCGVFPFLVTLPGLGTCKPGHMWAVTGKSDSTLCW